MYEVMSGFDLSLADNRKRSGGAMFTIDVISDPLVMSRSDEPDIYRADLRQLAMYDISLVKPALLFADKVNLISYRLDLQAAVRADAFRNSRMPMRFVHAFAALTRRGNEEEIERLGMPRNMMCSLEDAQAILESPDAMFDFAKKYDEEIRLHQELVAKALRGFRDALLSDELDLAVGKNILDCSAWHIDMPNSYQLNWAEVQEQFAPKAVEGLVNRLAATTGVPLLEPGAEMQLKRVLGRKKVVKAIRNNAALQAPVAVASGITSSIPGLNDLSVSEVIELRESLKDYLPAFRSSMIELSQEISKDTNSDPSLLAPEIDLYWHRDIAPALQEIEHEVSRAQYPRKLLSAFTHDKSVMAGTASAVMLAAGSVFAGVGALIPAAAAAAFPFVKALNDTLQSNGDVRKNRLYFLYAVQKHIEQRSV